MHGRHCPGRCNRALTAWELVLRMPAGARRNSAAPTRAAATPASNVHQPAVTATPAGSSCAVLLFGTVSQLVDLALLALRLETLDQLNYARPGFLACRLGGHVARLGRQRIRLTIVLLARRQSMQGGSRFRSSRWQCPDLGDAYARPASNARATSPKACTAPRAAQGEPLLMRFGIADRCRAPVEQRLAALPKPILARQEIGQSARLWLVANGAPTSRKMAVDSRVAARPPVPALALTPANPPTAMPSSSLEQRLSLEAYLLIVLARLATRSLSSSALAILDERTPAPEDCCCGWRYPLP